MIKPSYAIGDLVQVGSHSDHLGQGDATNWQPSRPGEPIMGRVIEARRWEFMHASEAEEPLLFYLIELVKPMVRRTELAHRIIFEPVTEIWVYGNVLSACEPVPTI